MPKRNRFQEQKRAQRTAETAAEREAEREAERRAREAFVMDPANVFADELWDRAECGGFHKGPCCGEPTCCL